MLFCLFLVAGVRWGFGGAIPLECRPKISMAVKKKCNFERRISLNWWSAGVHSIPALF